MKGDVSNWMALKNHSHDATATSTKIDMSNEFFVIPPQYKYIYDNNANFVLAVPFKIKMTNKVSNLER